MLAKTFWNNFFGDPYCSNSTKTHLDRAHKSLLFLDHFPYFSYTADSCNCTRPGANVKFESKRYEKK